MLRKKTKKRKKEPTLKSDFNDYWKFLMAYFKSRIYIPFSKFEAGKDVVVGALYKKRGKYTKPISHLATVSLAGLIVLVGPLLLEQQTGEGAGEGLSVLSVSANDEMSFYTLRAQEVQQYRGGEIITHVVEEDETLESIAQRYNLKVETIVWENNLASEKESTKVGQELRILPIDGMKHKVGKGETIYSIAKKYGLEEEQTQMIVDYPFNEFLDDETFALAVGQQLIVPYGIKPKAGGGSSNRPSYARQVMMTPDAGAVSASGRFVWPTAGSISQGYIPGIHRAIDISNRSLPAILAADSGTVIASGWDSSGYGNRVIIDHGNGFVTLYAHMSVVQVTAGQSVGKGGQIGIMGSTGRSTGPHLHFEVRSGGALLNPLGYL